MLHGFLLSFLTFVVCATAQDRRVQPNTETAFDRFTNRPKVIKPGLMVYGVPWTATIEEFKTAFGPPTGVFAIRSDAVALIYGRTHVLLFEKGELREVSIDGRLFNYVLEPHILPHVFFDARDLTIAPGIKLGMSPAEILAFIPGKFAVPGEREYTSSCALDNASLKFWYSTIRRAGQPDTKTVMSITVRGL
jgi:hypothetical protein